MIRPDTPVPILLLAALVAVPMLSGCLGQAEPADTGPALPIDTDVSFDSFDAAMAAEGDVFKPRGSAEPYEDTQSASVTSHDYSNQHSFPVTSTAVESIDVGATLSSGSPLDQLTVTLMDAGGNSVDSVQLTPDATSANLTTSDANGTGNWTIGVQGRGVGASYSLDITVEYVSTDPLTLKLFEPRSAIETGDHSFVFLLYDEATSSPVTDANVTLESWMIAMGHGTANDEADPVHDAHGVYVGKISPNMGGGWAVRLQVTLPGEEPVPFNVPVTAEG